MEKGVDQEKWLCPRQDMKTIEIQLTQTWKKNIY